MSVTVKICGITSEADALAAAEAGADAIGLMFYEGSPRHVTLEQAKAISAALPPHVMRVGVFVNAEGGVCASGVDRVHAQHFAISMAMKHRRNAVAIR